MEDPTFSLFGAPFLQRKEEIVTKIANPDSKYPIEIMGKMKQIPVISVRIEFPVYRLANGRTKSAQLEYLVLNPDTPENLFTEDHDAYAAQYAQHQILKGLVQEEDLLATFKNENLEQVEPIICTNTGVVVNGNRRLCAWRMLYYDDRNKYKTFQTISIAVLPELDDKAIEEIEKRLQIVKTMRAEYHWHTKALMAEQELQHGNKPAEVAKSFGLKKKELHNLISARQLAEQYLEEIGHKNEWSRVDKTYYAFESIVYGESKIQDQNERELFKKMAFRTISQSDNNLEDSPTGRLYSLIKDMAANISAIAAREASDIATEQGDEQQDNVPFDDEGLTGVLHDHESPHYGDEDAIEDDLELLAGGEDLQSDNAGIVSTAIDKGRDISLSKIQDIIDEQKNLQNNKDKATFLLDQLSKVSSLLQNAIDSGINENTQKEGVGQQLDAIQRKINLIREWLNR